MKLYTRKYVGHKHTPYEYTEVDPADLDKMNLGYYRLVQKMKTQLEKQVKLIRKLGWREEEARNAVQIRVGFKEIRDLESAADLKVPEMQVQARALEMWTTLRATAHSWEDETLLREMNKIEFSAQAEFATGPAKALPSSGQALRQSSG